MVIVGSAGGEWALRGFVAAYDATNGQQRWRWMSTDPKTYAGNSWESGGGMVWTTPAIDPKLGLLIFSTGNPNPDLDGTIRQGDNLYTDSIVALDVHSARSSGTTRRSSTMSGTTTPSAMSCSSMCTGMARRFRPPPRRGRSAGYSYSTGARPADPQVRPLRHDVEEHVLDADAAGRRYAAWRQWRRGVVAARVLTADALSVHHGDGPVDALHDEAGGECAGSHSPRQRIHECGARWDSGWSLRRAGC